MLTKMLRWNQERVRQLSPGEIWLFIVGRVLAAFGLGILVAMYVPQTDSLGWPCLVVGAVLLVVAARGLRRKSPPSGDTSPT